jgi:hypothetical protein
MTSFLRAHFPFVQGLLLAGALMAVPALHASRTGLNNIPTADVSAPRVAVVHVYSAAGPGRETSFLTGVRTGFSLGEQKFEAGVDSRWAPGEAVPVFFNAKWSLPVRPAGSGLALGVASLAPDAADRRRFGQPQSYGAVTHDFGLARVTAGYAVQAGNNAGFAGLDRKFLVHGRPLVLRGDVIEIQDGRHWLSSLGLTYRLSSAVGIELWQSHPTGPARDYTTVKLAGYIPF